MQQIELALTDDEVEAIKGVQAGLIEYALQYNQVVAAGGVVGHLPTDTTFEDTIKHILAIHRNLSPSMRDNKPVIDFGLESNGIWADLKMADGEREKKKVIANALQDVVGRFLQEVALQGCIKLPPLGE